MNATRIYGSIGCPFTKHCRRRDYSFFFYFTLISGMWSTVFFPYDQVSYTCQTYKPYISSSAGLEILRLGNWVFFTTAQTVIDGSDTSRRGNDTSRLPQTGKTIFSETAARALVRVYDVRVLFLRSVQHSCPLRTTRGERWERNTPYRCRVGPRVFTTSSRSGRLSETSNAPCRT